MVSAQQISCCPLSSSAGINIVWFSLQVWGRKEHLTYFSVGITSFYIRWSQVMRGRKQTFCCPCWLHTTNMNQNFEEALLTESFLNNLIFRIFRIVTIITISAPIYSPTHFCCCCRKVHTFANCVLHIFNKLMRLPHKHSVFAVSTHLVFKQEVWAEGI